MEKSVISPEDAEIPNVGDNELLTDDEEESNTTLVEDDSKKETKFDLKILKTI